VNLISGNVSILIPSTSMLHIENYLLTNVCNAGAAEMPNAKLNNSE